MNIVALVPLRVKNCLTTKGRNGKRQTGLTSQLTSNRHLLILMPVAPLPTELVSSIVAAYFDSVAPFSLATPKSTPTPSNVAVAQPLLLASRALRRLTLPHVYRSLTIARRSDWLTLFHPERGLLARTPEGDERWSWLEELCVVSNVEPPWNEEGSLQTGNSASWFGPMLVPRAEEGGAGIWMATTRRR
jgi:hypothetical protein